MNEPIMEFKDEAQAYECLKEWQTRLFLDEWFIKIELLEMKDMPDGNCVGYCSKCIPMQTAKILLVKFTDEVNKHEYIRFCHEKILIHELLHIKYMAIDSENVIIQDWDEYQHQKIEQLAKSFIMAKYMITFDWFKNF